MDKSEKVTEPAHQMVAFQERLEPESELWSFRGRWKTQYRDWQMQGYVPLHGEEIGPYFLASQ